MLSTKIPNLRDKAESRLNKLKEIKFLTNLIYCHHQESPAHTTLIITLNK